jgi:hypothetical protein
VATSKVLSRPRIRLDLYYDERAPYAAELERVLSLVKELERSTSAEASLHGSKDMGKDEAANLVDAIRSIIPQERGSIVTSRGVFLPLSKSKKLNLGNTPVLVVRLDERLSYVFPCKIGERYYDLVAGLEHLKSSWPLLRPLSEPREEKTIVELVAHDPSIIENGLELMGIEIGTGSGFADLLLKDPLGNITVIEVERETGDAAIGQVLRLAAALEKEKRGVEVRGAIVCMRIRDGVLAAAARANIGVWLVESLDPFTVSKLRPDKTAGRKST